MFKLIMLTLVVVGSFHPCMAHSIPEFSPKEIQPSHVFGLVEYLERDVRDLAAKIGVPLRGNTVFYVENAEPREVYFQATSVRIKAFKLLNRFMDPDQSRFHKPSKITPYHVYGMVKQAQMDLRNYANAVGVMLGENKFEIAEGKTPSDVYNLLLRVNALLYSISPNSLTSRNIQLHLQSIIETLFAWNPLGPKSLVLSQRASFGKYPKDILLELVKAFSHTKAIAKRNNIKILDLRVLENGSDTNAGHVYDLVRLLRSEIKHIYSVSGKHEEPDKYGVIPKYSFYSHNYSKVRAINLFLVSSIEGTKGKK